MEQNKNLELESATLEQEEKSAIDFYTLFDKYVMGEELDNLEQEHYVMAVLVRGGVFGQSSKE